MCLYCSVYEVYYILVIYSLYKHQYLLYSYHITVSIYIPAVDRFNALERLGAHAMILSLCNKIPYLSAGKNNKVCIYK